MKLRALLATAATTVALVATVASTPTAEAAVAPGTPYTVGQNDLGQLGTGAGGSRTAAAAVSSLSDIVDLHGGREHVVALRQNGTVVTWGSNDSGQLGIGVTGGSRNTPQAVPGLTDVVAVTTGHYHAMALKGDGSIWTWGLNASGQLGDGSTTIRNSPVRVSGSGTGSAVYTGIAAGRDMSYGLRSDGTVWAWGLNGDGQLGDGTTTTRTTPVRVGSLTDIVTIAGGRDHGLAVSSTGAVWAWGWNAYGMIGDGTTTNRLSPVQVTTGGRKVSAGAHHSYLLRTDGTVYAWGRNYRAELGDGSTTNRTRPVRVGSLTDVVAIASGRDHGLAMLADGTVRAWGDNAEGQLGDGTTTQRSSPVVMQGVTGATLGGGGSAYSVVLSSASTPPVDQPPTAVIGATCTGLSCTLTSTGSSDPDGTIASRAWTFGDQTAGSSATTVTHAYAEAGTYTVGLTVTDDDGLTGTATRQVTVTEAPPSTVAFRAAASANRNVATSTLTIPAAVQAGDQLVLFVTSATNLTPATPAGWTSLGSRTDAEVRSTAFTRQATAAGGSVSVAFGSATKSDLSLVAYAGAAPVTGAASAAEAGTSASHTSPALATTAGSVVVSYFVDKATAHAAWSLPATVTARTSSLGSGSGVVGSVTADAATSAGTWPGVTATSPVSSGKAIAWSVLVPTA